MQEWEALLYNVVNIMKMRLELLKETGLTYIEKQDAGAKTIQNKTALTDIKALSDLRQYIGDCKLCGLCQGRKNIVFGSGNPQASLVFVGEGPGAEEDLRGEPFVGRAGELLSKMITAMGLRREEVYICNVVKCRPPQNRDPEPEEISACIPFLKQQLALIKPQIIVGLGRHACQTLLRTTTAMSKLRGQWSDYEGIKFMPTFHPAYLLRNPSKKKEVWDDLQMVMAAIHHNSSLIGNDLAGEGRSSNGKG